LQAGGQLAHSSIYSEPQPDWQPPHPKMHEPISRRKPQTKAHGLMQQELHAAGPQPQLGSPQPPSIPQAGSM